MNKKPWYTSKTVIYNGAVFVGAVVAAAAVFTGQLAEAGVVSVGVVSAVVAVDRAINIALRFMTTMGIGKGE